MSLELQFSLQWNKFVKDVNLRIKKAYRNQRTRKISDPNIIIDEVVSFAKSDRWFNEGSFEGAWLRKLVSKHPSKGQDFRNSLHAVNITTKFSRYKEFESFEIVIIFVTLAITSLASFLQYDLLHKIFFGMTVGLTSISIIAYSRTYRMHQYLKSVISVIHQELAQAKVELDRILNNIDSAHLPNDNLND